jgi:ectoine hydroxylase-related dioxygenase (phytanoyl-CoA dioxygenase family)
VRGCAACQIAMTPLLSQSVGEPVPHPWNSSFTWQSPRPPFRRVTDAEAAQFDQEGWFVVDRLVDDTTLASITDEIDRREAKVEAFLRTQPDERMMIAEAGALTVSIHLAARSTVLRDLACSSAIADLCADLVGPDVNLYWDQAVYKKPEKPRRVPWHQDNGYTYIEPQQYLTVWLALTDATEDNGCPIVAPGVHRMGTLAHTYVEPLGYECFSEPPRAVRAPVAAGGAVVFSSLTPHLTGPNLTDEVRKAYILQYAPAGAETLVGDPAAGSPVERRPCDDPDRQFPILRGGRAA